jgi:hypothetical protein
MVGDAVDKNVICTIKLLTPEINKLSATGLKKEYEYSPPCGSMCQSFKSWHRFCSPNNDVLVKSKIGINS